MLRNAVKPRRYRDRLDAIYDTLEKFVRKGGIVDVGANPNGQYSLLTWAHDEIVRLRKLAGIEKPAGSKFITGPRKQLESQVLMKEDFDD